MTRQENPQGLMGNFEYTIIDAAIGPILYRTIERLNIERRGLPGLEKIRRHLTEGGSTIIAFNHLSIIDPGIVIKSVVHPISHAATHIVFPTSYKFVDGRLGLAGELVNYLARKWGIEEVPMIQHNDTSVDDSIKLDINKAALKRITEVLKEPGSVVGLAPEGTRSRNRSMGQAQGGILQWLAWKKEIKDRVLIIPVSLDGTDHVHFEDEQHRSHWSLSSLKSKIMVFIGEPLTLQQAKDYAKDFDLPIHDFIMLTIASHLPSRYWGYYNRYADKIGQLQALNE